MFCLFCKKTIMFILPSKFGFRRTNVPGLACVFLFCILCIGGWPTTALTSEDGSNRPPESPANPQDEPALLSEIVHLPPVTVVASPEPMTGKGSHIQSETLEKLPLRNNSINEALTILPGVQFSETADISTQGGEILPPGVSISGGKIYENNFTIDGISNNSLLDPNGKTNLDAPNDLPGHPQEMFLDASLVDKITVYDSNVSARYGNFKGGVVNAETIRPLPQFTGKVFYRTTRDEWTSFHLDPEKEEDFLSSTDHREQPKFRKHHYGLDLHIPLTPRLLTVGGYRQLYSRIPLRQEDGTKTQQRREENFLFKTLFQPSASTNFDFLWTYTPYDGTYFKNGFRDSDYRLSGGGHLFSVACHTRMPLATLDTQVAYRASENSRKAPTNVIQTELSKNVWDKEGFYGDLDKTQQSFQFKSDLSFLPVSLGPTNHLLNAGIDTQYIEGRFERPETSYLYTYLLNDNPFSTSDDYPNRRVYGEYDVKADLRQYGFYLEDIITWGGLELRPGMRIDYDDYMHNLHLAPRLAIALDVFSNRQTILIGGYNRYYANTLLTYKLREGIQDEYFEQLIAGEWTFWKRKTTDTKFSDLKTPYTDEYVLGLEQQLFGGTATVKYIHRKGKSEFAQTFEKEADGIYYYSLNNNGRSRHESYLVSWERQWHNHYVSINGTYQETESSNESYEETVDEEDLEERVWYNGRSINKNELPREDFNRPWVVNLTYVGRLPYGFSLSGMAKYRSGYRVLKDTKEDIVLPNGDSLSIYDEVKMGGAVTISCRADWEKQLYRNHRMVLTLEINNLLNKKSSVGDTDDYEIGRQVWAGMEYHF